MHTPANFYYGCVFFLFSFRDYIQKPTAKEEYRVITQYWSIQKKSPILRWVFLSPKEYMQVLTLSDLHRSELIGKGFDSNLKYQLIYKCPFPVRFFNIPISLGFLHILNEPDFSEDIESKSRDSSGFWKSDCGWFFSKKVRPFLRNGKLHF